MANKNPDMSGLILITERSEEEQRKMRSKGGINSGITRAAKIKRSYANEYIWETLGMNTVEEVMSEGTLQQRIDLIKAVLPKDKQEIAGNIELTRLVVRELKTDDRQDDGHTDTISAADNDA